MGDPIRIFNRLTGRYETEPVYGERWLRWAYERPLGRCMVWAVAKRAWFSRWYGWRMARVGSRARVAPFIERFGIDAGEFADPPGRFASFNEFFIRRLRAGVRPVDAAPEAVVFPADGRHLGLANAAETNGVYAKGQSFDVPRLLGPSVTDAPRTATVVISRLCPIDYHRFHFAEGGRAGPPLALPGDLYSVSPIALRRTLNYLFANKRVVTEIRHERHGTFWQVEIGATNVGRIEQTFGGPREVARGEEKGCFHFGGSCVVTVFPPNRVRLEKDLLERTAEGVELYAHVGQRMATWLS